MQVRRGGAGACKKAHCCCSHRGRGLSAQRLLMPGDCLPASFNGKACYFRLDKKAKRTDTWTVGVCNKGTADTAGEKPGASGGLHKMTAAEIRAALAVEEEVKEVIDH